MSELTAEPQGRDGTEAAVRIGLSVRNSGAMEAEEVVQIYLQPPGRARERPERSLVAFRRLRLAPGQAGRVELAIPLRRLASFDAERDRFVLDAGMHRFLAARHAEDEGLAVDLHLEEAVLGP
jgi:beta-glucosidase